MKKTGVLLAVILAVLNASPAHAGGDASDPLRQRFAADEQWKLDVILSDDKQRQAFEADAAAAKTIDEQAQATLRWRKKIVQFSTEYKKHLETTDIVPNAPSVEKMVSEEEFAVTNYWLNRQSEETKKSVVSDIALGNTLLAFKRDLVENKIREKRKKTAAALGEYLISPEAKQAAAYTEPKPAAEKPAEKPAPKPAAEPTQTASAKEQLKKAAEEAEKAKASEPQKAAETAGNPFSGGAAHEKTTVVVPPQLDDSAPGKTGPNPAAALAPSVSSTPHTSFTVKPPPKPLLDQTKPVQEKKFLAAALKYGPTVLGGLLGAILGVVFGGPLGLLIGAAIGAGAGWLAGKMLLSNKAPAR